MINNKDIEEIRNRDFLKDANHFRRFDAIETKYLFGNRISNPFLTVIIPIYDHPFKLMRRALESVLFQKYDYNVQILIIDDYAQRSEPSEFEKYVKSIDDYRIVYYKNVANLGVFGNWNRGIELAESEWVTILHTDDFYRENYLQTMKNIIDMHPEIDQLACNYKLINLLDSTTNISDEFRGFCGKANVFKVSYLDYMYQMFTSVKGSMYKRKTLIDIGGFRSQGDGLGLDDYPLMLRYAYKYNTYLLDEVMYIDSWGYNDSMYTKHWYPELIENYYMWLYFANKEHGFLRKILKIKAKYLLSIRAKQFSEGTSWVGIPVDIDFDELKKICNIEDYHVNKTLNRILSIIIRVIFKIRKGHIDRFNISIATNKSDHVIS